MDKTYFIRKTNTGYVGVDYFNNPIPLEVLISLHKNIGCSIEEIEEPIDIIKPKHKHSKGYIYLIRYVLNGFPMIKLGRSNNKTRAVSYKHLDSFNLIINKPVYCQYCVEKELLDKHSNKRNEYIPHSKTKESDILKDIKDL